MSQIRRCQDCEAELAADAPEGLCPRCLMKAGLGSQADAGTGLPHAASGGVPEAAAGAGSAAGFAPTVRYSPSGRFVPPEPVELARHFPQLEILELLGQGGMGAVYKARQRQLNRLVALKILPPEVAGDPAFAERFTREAQALAQFNHPHVVTVHDFGEAGGLFYFIMEFVDGVNLRQMLAGGNLEPREALAIVPQICEALQYAHDDGVVHRDIKPENILIDKKGRVKIADFGLAKLLRRDDTPAGRAAFTLTGSQQVMGTPHYMAPEQMERPLSVDHRADIYSLGVVFYEMLTGELPLGRFAPPSQKVEIDVRLDEVVLRSLEKEPERRYQHASDVKTEVETIVREPVLSRGSLAAFKSSSPAEASPDSRPANQPEKPGLPTGFWFLLGLGLFAVGMSMHRMTAGFSPGLVFIFAGIGCWIGELVRSRISRRSQPQSPGPVAPQRLPTEVDVEAAAHQVKGPAIGLLIAGIIQCAVAVFLWLWAAWFTGFSEVDHVMKTHATEVQRTVPMESPARRDSNPAGQVIQRNSGD